MISPTSTTPSSSSPSSLSSFLHINSCSSHLLQLTQISQQLADHDTDLSIVKLTQTDAVVYIMQYLNMRDLLSFSASCRCISVRARSRLAWSYVMKWNFTSSFEWPIKFNIESSSMFLEFIRQSRYVINLPILTIPYSLSESIDSFPLLLHFTQLKHVSFRYADVYKIDKTEIQSLVAMVFCHLSKTLESVQFCDVRESTAAVQHNIIDQLVMMRKLKSVSIESDHSELGKLNFSPLSQLKQLRRFECCASVESFASLADLSPSVKELKIGRIKECAWISLLKCKKLLSQITKLDMCVEIEYHMKDFITISDFCCFPQLQSMAFHTDYFGVGKKSRFGQSLAQHRRIDGYNSPISLPPVTYITVSSYYATHLDRELVDNWHYYISSFPSLQWVTLPAETIASGLYGDYIFHCPILEVDLTSRPDVDDLPIAHILSHMLITKIIHHFSQYVEVLAFKGSACRQFCDCCTNQTLLHELSYMIPVFKKLRRIHWRHAAYQDNVNEYRVKIMEMNEIKKFYAALTPQQRSSISLTYGKFTNPLHITPRIVSDILSAREQLSPPAHKTPL